ncbi:speckle-type POZ protein-like A [Cotesia glomerata]|uniref:speckle-type POZ protein-like A n=1 Tax=Cotesia glomerata TaxID=32391 RepID=UPI001D012166|nr:speckle-type POZ protein-like A [Cotesia glomerata]
MSNVVKESLIHKGYSHSETHSIVYEWTIDHISSFLRSAKSQNERERNDIIVSPKFLTGGKNKNTWCLELSIEKQNDEPEHYSWVSLHLLRPCNGRRNVRTKFFFFFVNTQKEKIMRDFETYHHPVEDGYLIHFPFDRFCGYECARFVKIDKLLEKISQWSQNDTLTIGLDLIVYDDYVSNDPSISPLKASLRTIGDDFKDFFAAKKKCDVKIQVGSEIFDAHKVILIARSCVFDAMFSHDMKESEENEITIPDVDPVVFKKVLDYIYTDKVEDLDTFAEELLEVSDKYQLLALKEICEESLSRTISVENSIRRLVLADRHNSERLVKFTNNYIVVKLASLRNTEEYKALEESYPALFLAILKEHVARIGTD